MKAICDAGCNMIFEAVLITKWFDGISVDGLPDRIEKVYFTCPKCRKEYLCFYTDTETRRLQEAFRNNSFIYGRMNGKTMRYENFKNQSASRMKKLKTRYGE